MPKVRQLTVARPVCLGGHNLHTIINDDDGRAGAVRCSVCRQSSTKPKFCTTRCKGSAASKWAEAAKRMADNDVIDGGGHARMISGDVI